MSLLVLGYKRRDIKVIYTSYQRGFYPSLFLVPPPEPENGGFRDAVDGGKLRSQTPSNGKISSKRLLSRGLSNSTPLKTSISPENQSGWWFYINIFYFHPYLGKIPNLTNFFSKVLKPPSSFPPINFGGQAVRFWEFLKRLVHLKMVGVYLGKDWVFGDSGEMEGSILQVNIRIRNFRGGG